MKWLHISDLHFNPKDDGLATRGLREKFSNYAREKNIVGIDEVFFTGDFRHAVNQKGQPIDEVSSNAVNFLREIAECVGVKNERNIHIVPGNHDLSRKKNDNSILEEIYKNYDPLNGKFSNLKFLRKRFDFFCKCVVLLNNTVWKDFENGLLHRPGLFSNSDSYGILYVNTAIASGHSEFKKKLFIGTDDFDKALKQIDGEIIIALAHNPLSHLNENEQNVIKNIINDNGKPVLWLCGDAHRAQYDNPYKIACITTGCMTHHKETEASFIVGEYKKYKGVTIAAHGYTRHSNWQFEEGLSKRITDSIPKEVRATKSGKLTENNNLPERNEYFTGREDKLYDIHKSLSQNEGVGIRQTVSGLGGIGKTQLAIEYAYYYCDSYDSAVWFVVAETTTTVQNYFADFAKKLSLPLQIDYKSEDLQREVTRWLSENKNWLIIFDNLEYYDVVKPYLPNQINGRIIITTRNTRIGVGVPIELDVFNSSESIAFLQRRLSKNETVEMELYGFDDFDTQAPLLAERLGFLPLALEQAAAYIKEVKCKITDYLKLLDESGLLAFEEKQALPEHYEKINSFEKIVTATWNISFNNITNEGAKQLLNLCAYMAPDRIPIAFFAEMREKLPSPIKEDMAHKLSRNRIVAELRTYSLTLPSSNAYYIDIHRLVQEVVRKNHEEKDDENGLA